MNRRLSFVQSLETRLKPLSNTNGIIIRYCGWTRDLAGHAQSLRVREPGFNGRSTDVQRTFKSDVRRTFGGRSNRTFKSDFQRTHGARRRGRRSFERERRKQFHNVLSFFLFENAGFFAPRRRARARPWAPTRPTFFCSRLFLNVLKLSRQTRSFRVWRRLFGRASARVFRRLNRVEIPLKFR